MQLPVGSPLPQEWGPVVESVCSGARRPGFEGLLGCVILSKAVSLSEPRFLVCKVGMMAGPPPVA